MPNILRSDASLIVTRDGEDHLGGQNNVSIQGFVIGRWATLSPCLSPEDRRLAHHSGGEGEVFQGGYQRVEAPQALDFLRIFTTVLKIIEL